MAEDILKNLAEACRRERTKFVTAPVVKATRTDLDITRAVLLSLREQAGDAEVVEAACNGFIRKACKIERVPFMPLDQQEEPGRSNLRDSIAVTLTAALDHILGEKEG